MLFEAYAALLNEFPDGCDQLFGTPISTDNSWWLSMDSEACPSLLFAARGGDSRNDIELRSISVHFSRDCNIETVDGSNVSGLYTIVRVNENDPDIVRMLLRLLEEVFGSSSKPLSNGDIATRIMELAELFKRIAESNGDALGLWGELYIISCAEDLIRAVRCWCINKTSKYDYVTDDFVIEAKTTLLTKRKHRFSLEQLRPNSEIRIYIASLVVVELNSGRSVGDLIDDLSANINDDELRRRFIMQCMVKGGSDIYRDSLRLSVFPDAASLVIFDAANIPVPKVEQTAPIENVRFDVDLSGVPPVSEHDVYTILSFGMR